MHDDSIEKSDEAAKKKFSTFSDAAVEAELATGVREDTVADAKRNIVFRLARISSGFLVLALGLAAIPLPGPGWLIVGVGLAILAQDFVWAERTLNIVRKRLPQDADGKIPSKTWWMIGVATTITVGLTAWFYMLR